MESWRVPSLEGSSALDLASPEVVPVLLAAHSQLRDITILSHVGDYESQQQHIAVLKLLVAAGANINGKSMKGLSALVFAAVEGFADMVEYLISAHADVNQTLGHGRGQPGMTALQIARKTANRKLYPERENDYRWIETMLVAAGAT